MKRVVLCMKWGTLYSADYVNVLYRAVADHMTWDFRFVCLTDDGGGIIPDVECLPIPDIGLEPQHWRGGAWPKLSVFKDDLYDLEGRALFIDLDTVVCGSLDGMFEVDGALVALDSRPWRYKEGAPRTGTGIFAFDLGSCGAVVDGFRARISEFCQKYENEQDFLHGEFEGLGPGPIRYWPDEWIRSFKYHQRQPLLIDRFKGPKPPSGAAKILCFHGRPRPIDLIRPPKGNWDVFPHYGRGPVDWMVEYWTRYGGSV